MAFPFSIRDTNAECFMLRLSFLEFMKLSLTVAEVTWTRGRAMRPEPELGLLVVGRDLVEDLARIDGRFLGAVGAWIC